MSEKITLSDLAKHIKQTVPKDIQNELKNLEKTISKQIKNRESLYSSVKWHFKYDKTTGKLNDNKKSEQIRNYVLNEASGDKQNSSCKKAKNKLISLETELKKNIGEFEVLYRFFFLDDNLNQVKDVQNTKLQALHEKYEKLKNIDDKKPYIAELNFNKELEDAGKDSSMIKNIKDLEKYTQSFKNYSGCISRLKTTFEESNVEETFNYIKRHMKNYAKKIDKDDLTIDTDYKNLKNDYKNIKEYRNLCVEIYNALRAMQYKAKSDSQLHGEYVNVVTQLEHAIKKFNPIDNKVQEIFAFYRYGEFEAVDFSNITNVSKSLGKVVSSYSLLLNTTLNLAKQLVVAIKVCSNTTGLLNIGKEFLSNYATLNGKMQKAKDQVDKLIESNQSADMRRESNKSSKKKQFDKLLAQFNKANSSAINKGIADAKTWLAKYDYRHSTMGRIKRAAPYAGMVVKSFVTFVDTLTSVII